MTGFINTKKHLMTLFVTLFLIVLEGCGAIPPSSVPWFRSDVLPPLEGQILDADSGEPIEGAIILIKWETDAGHSHWTCPHVVTVVTDENGHFRSPGWDGWKEAVRTTREPPVVYKPGYEAVEGADGDAVWYLRRSEMSAQERLDYLVTVMANSICAGVGEKTINAYNMLKTIYEEGKTLQFADTAENNKVLNGLLRSAASAYVSKDAPLSARERHERIEAYIRKEEDLSRGSKFGLFLKPPLKGLVKDSETGNPIENVAVLVEWHNWGDKQNPCRSSFLAITDSNGRYQYLGRKDLSADDQLKKLPVRHVLYKPGYEFNGYSANNSGQFFGVRDSGSPYRRIEHLLFWVRYSACVGDEDRDNLINKIYKEAKSMLDEVPVLKQRSAQKHIESIQKIRDGGARPDGSLP